MRRRTFTALAAGVISSSIAPRPASAQQPGRRPVVGIIGANTEDIDRPLYVLFLRRLAELGWIEERSVTIAYRSSDGLVERVGAIAAELVALGANLIVTAGDAQVRVAQHAAAATPVLFVAVGDPVGNGLVASLARPGGNITGLSLALTDTAAKRFELLREVVPDLQRLAIMGHFANPHVEQELRIVRSAARARHLDTVQLDFAGADDIDPAIRSLAGGAQALYLCLDPLAITLAPSINRAALAARLATMHGIPQSVASGGLLAYAADRTAHFRRAAEMADRILRGTKPADLPVEEPTKFELVLNLRTAKALGLEIPRSILMRADAVIE